MSHDSRDGVLTTKQQFLVMSRMSFHWGSGLGGGGGGGGILSREIIFRVRARQVTRCRGANFLHFSDSPLLCRDPIGICTDNMICFQYHPNSGLIFSQVSCPDWIPKVLFPALAIFVPFHSCSNTFQALFIPFNTLHDQILTFKCAKSVVLNSGCSEKLRGTKFAPFAGKLQLRPTALQT